MRNCYWLFLGLFAAPSCAQQVTAQEVLAKVRDAYGTLTAVHVIAEREELRSFQGRQSSGSVQLELADKGGGRYFTRLKGDREAFAVSDGGNIFKALVSSKQWSKVSAAGVAGGGEEEESDSQELDLHSNMQRMLLSHFAALAKAAEDAVIVKEDDYKLGGRKVRCYQVRAHARDTQLELLVDKERFVVLQEKQRGVTQEGSAEITLKMKLVELNDEVNDALFHFEPGKGWRELEMLVLPGEGQLTLVGERAANFTLKSVAGEQVALANLRGKVVVLDFWATWCSPCREELPHVEKLRAEFGDAVEFYGVNDEDNGTVKRFQREHHYELPVLMDDKRAVHRLYNVRAIPTLLVVDRGGVIRQSFTGGRSEDALRKAIQSVVESK